MPSSGDFAGKLTGIGIGRTPHRARVPRVANNLSTNAAPNIRPWPEEINTLCGLKGSSEPGG